MSRPIITLGSLKTSGGTAIGPGAMATGAGGHIVVNSPGAHVGNSGSKITVKETDRNRVLVALTKLQTALLESESEHAPEADRALDQFKEALKQSPSVDRSWTETVLAKVRRVAEVAKPVAEALKAMAELLGLP